MLKVIKQARAAFALLNPEEVRHRVNRAVTFGLVAADDHSYGQMEEFLIPPNAPAEQREDLSRLVFRAGDRDVPDKVDLVLYQDGIPGPQGTYMFHRDQPEKVISDIVRENEDLALALARRYPAFRKPVLRRTIQSIARENAFFAVATALPDVIPSLLELPWAFGEFASDTAFMTANQVRMAFLIAAACGKEVGYTQQKAEIAGITAGAFGWRAIARELAGKIPFGGGLIPKGAIAYAVTYCIGKGLARVHQSGKPYSRAERREVYQQAFARGKTVAQAITAGQQPQ